MFGWVPCAHFFNWREIEVLEVLPRSVDSIQSDRTTSEAPLFSDPLDVHPLGASAVYEDTISLSDFFRHPVFRG
jgi:hypothetical protein